MKFILIFWICLNDPSIGINETCHQIPMSVTYDSLDECKFAANYIHERIQDPKVYATAFCAQKNLTSI